MNEASLLTIYNWLAQAQQQLQSAGIGTARLDALVLLCDVLERDKSWALAHPDYIITNDKINVLNYFITHRSQHIPLAYIRGHSEFYGREFTVNTNVLVPRPESEAIIILLMRYAQKHPVARVIDIGTGSGALAVTAKLELPNIDVLATDISDSCLQTAEANAATLGADVRFVRSDLLTAITPLQEHTVLLCNLPYVPGDYPINTAATHEPKLALFSGPDGLDHYRALFAQIDALAAKPVCIITESLMDQHEALNLLATKYGYRTGTEDGLAQQFVLAG